MPFLLIEILYLQVTQKVIIFFILPSSVELRAS